MILGKMPDGIKMAADDYIAFPGEYFEPQN